MLTPLEQLKEKHGIREPIGKLEDAISESAQRELDEFSRRQDEVVRKSEEWRCREKVKIKVPQK